MKAQRSSELRDIQSEYRQRRKGQRQGKFEAVMSGMLGRHRAGPANVAPAVTMGIGIEYLAVR